MISAILMFFCTPKAKVEKMEDKNRRSFIGMSSSVAQTETLSSIRKTYEEITATIKGKSLPRTNTPIIPVGARDFATYSELCTACQMCVAACPQRVLQPTFNIESLMIPEIKYESSYCDPNCISCNIACSTGALQIISKEEKQHIRIGNAVWIRKNCMNMEKNSGNDICDACVKACPKGAITLNDHNKKIVFPSIDDSRCVGCGACVAACPTTPRAIYVDGFDKHRQIVIEEDIKTEENNSQADESQSETN